MPPDVTLTLPTQTETQHTHFRSICARLTSDPFVTEVLVEEDAAHPYTTHINITYLSGHTAPRNSDARRFVLAHANPTGRLPDQAIVRQMTHNPVPRRATEDTTLKIVDYAQLERNVMLTAMQSYGDEIEPKATEIPSWLYVGAHLVRRVDNGLGPVVVTGFGSSQGSGPVVTFERLDEIGRPYSLPLNALLVTYITVPYPLTAWAKLISDEDAY